MRNSILFNRYYVILHIKKKNVLFILTDDVSALLCIFFFFLCIQYEWYVYVFYVYSLKISVYN